MTFFKKAARKTVLQGLFAWGIYQIYYLIENIEPGYKNLGDMIISKFLSSLGIPALATFGFEDMLSRWNGTAFDIDTSSINFIGSVLSSFAVPNIKSEFSIPIALFAFSLYYNFLAETLAENAPIEAPQENLRHPRQH